MNLKQFNMNLKTELLVDASKLFGLGYILLQLPEGYTNFKDTQEQNLITCESIIC